MAELNPAAALAIAVAVVSEHPNLTVAVPTLLLVISSAVM
jgi:hypothetical protein